jgi:peptide/nickel transport system permease protein
MGQYIAKRLLLGAITLVTILAVSYLLLRLAPGDPTKSNVIGENTGENISAEKGALAKNLAMREKLHLDQPIYIGFCIWMKSVVLHADFGSSASVDIGKPVTAIIIERLPITLLLNIMAIAVTYILAIPLGIYSAIYVDTLFDRIVTFSLFFLYSLPGIWVALVLQVTLCEGGFFQVFPLKGLNSISTVNMNSWEIIWTSLQHYILPVVCLAYAGFAGLSRYARSSMLDVINQDYIRTARAKGAAESTVIFKHALRNSMITLITLFSGLLPGLIAGSILIEYVFSIPGMGSLSLLALSSRDYPVLMALFAFAAVLTLLGVLLSDLLYLIVDPRISLSGNNKS